MTKTMSYSNSPLATYTKLSPNCNSPRTHEIDTITIHTMAGNMSVQSCGEMFANPARQASSNYGIDSNGTIALYVEEQNRSWCSSSKANDHRAITIEVASINTTDWAPSSLAYESLIRLVADICRRNNIQKLIWSNDKTSRVNHVNGCNMTVHRDYAATACPADWLYSHMGEIATRVNALITVDNSSANSIPDSNEGTSDNTVDNEVVIWNFLGDLGLNDFAKAAFMGNLFAESGLASNNLQNSFEAVLGHSDDSYTKAVDNGSYTNFVRDGAGYGICQWTFWSRKEGLLNLAKSTNRSIADINCQLEYLKQELTSSYKSLYESLKKVTSVQEASDLVLIKFENPGGYGNNMPQSYRNSRATYSQGFYDKYASGTKNKCPYLVKVTCSSLRIRKGAGTDYAQVGLINDRGVYTIVEESSGKGANTWGKLKSGAGWIAVDSTYVSKL